MTSPRVVYTLGMNSIDDPESLAAIVEGIDATLVDIRGKRITRRRGFGSLQLAALLGERYTWLGETLGGVNHLPNARKLWPVGLEKLAAIERPIIMCACATPIDCHRQMLAWEIVKRAPLARVVHVFEDETIDAPELARAYAISEHYDCYRWSDPDEIVARWEGEFPPPIVTWDASDNRFAST